MNRNNQTGRPFGFIIILLGLAIVLMYMNSLSSSGTAISRKTFESGLAQGEIVSVTINQNPQTPTGEADILWKSGEINVYNVSDVNALQEELEEYNIDYITEDVPQESFIDTWLPFLLSIGAMVLIFVLMQNKAGGGMQMNNFGKSRARMTKDNKLRFKDVAGLDEEKEDLEDIVDFLKNPKKYSALGARIPKGIILEGPPGTGKTMLAKAIAGEAGVPFFSISGSDFVEMFVGVGASRVRDLFNDAKKNSPCLVFIDEIDAVGRRRGSGLGGSHDEREQTLNQLLVEMDGFEANQGIIVLAATNRSDILDPALLRPGRFDRRIGVGRPDAKGREEILKVHAKNKPIGDDVDLNKVAKTTAGFTGADLENLLNESAILAAKAGKKFITQSDIEKSFIRIGIGAEKKSRVISDKEKRITAYHEAGHAILFHDLSEMDAVHTISIIPTGHGAAGYTMPLPEKDEMFNTREKMRQHIMVSYGGRIAEELVFDDITTGASQDIKQATKIAKAMVMQYGMSDKLGMINYGNEGDEIFIGRDMGTTKSYSEHMAELIDEEIKRITDECYAEAKKIILSRRDILDKTCALLLEKEKISGEEFDALYTE